MKSERIEYRRKDWDAYIAEEQLRLNESLEMIHPQLTAWEDRINNAIDENNHQQASDYVRTAIHELDRQWEHFDDLLLVAGQSYFPKPMIEALQNPTDPFTREYMLGNGVSNGFNYAADQNDQRIRLGMEVIVGYTDIDQHPYRMRGHYYAVVPLDEAAFTAVRPSDQEESLSANAEYIEKSISQALSRYSELLLDPNSHFYRMTREEQDEVLEYLTGSLNSELPDEAMNDHLYMQGSFPHAYVYQADQGKLVELRCDDLTSYAGTVRGFTTLESCVQKASPQPLRSPKDLHSPDAGIVAALDVHHSSAGFESDKHLYYVPLRLGKDLQLNVQ